MEAQVAWMAPSPMWSKLAARLADNNGQRDELRRPLILRFASDTFIEDLQAQLASAPEELETLAARPEHFRARPAGTKPGDWTTPRPADDVLKLYQPAHGHFYLVTCSLICRLAGMPDRVVDSAQQERVSFVLRRVRPNPDDAGELIEYAFVAAAPMVDAPLDATVAVASNGASPRAVMAQRATAIQRALDAEKAAGGSVTEPQPGWVGLNAQQQRTLLPGEEQLPFFPLRFVQSGQPRRLLAGYVPVAARERYATAAVTGTAAEPAPFLAYDPKLELQEKVLAALHDLDDAQVISNAQARDVSRFALLDLIDFLLLYLPNVHAYVVDANAPAPGATDPTLMASLDTWTVNGSASWRTALRNVWEQRGTINATGAAAGVVYDLRQSRLSAGGPTNLAGVISGLRNEIAAALPAGAIFTPPDPLPPAPKNQSTRGDQYVIRAVYTRPNCRSAAITVSARTVPFYLAPFLDFDAPMRPVTITLPDTNLADLRKFGRNVSIVISQKLSEQIQQATGVDIGDLESGTIGGASGALAMICTFSIPIITICALILLMIIVQLLNIVFWWLPLFKICIPIPRVD